MRVRFLPAAIEELLAAAQWYEDQRPGLGVEFLAEVDDAVDQIAQNPEAWSLWRDDRPYRKRVLDRFPYVVFFLVRSSEEIEIVAAAHGHRRPGYWGTRNR